MPQILRNPNDTITVTVDAANARYPTAVILPPRGARPGEADTVTIAPTTNVGRYAWDVDEGADATVAASFPIAAGAALTLPIPPQAKTAAEVALRRHAITITVDTALADAETLTISDGTNTIILESDAGNNGVGGGSTEIGTNASTAATQAAGIAAALVAWGSGAYVRGEVDAQSTTTVVCMAHTAAKTITVTGGAVTSTSTANGITTTVRDLGTGIVTITDYGQRRPVLYVLSATVATAISVSCAAA